MNIPGQPGENRDDQKRVQIGVVQRLIAFGAGGPRDVERVLQDREDRVDHRLKQNRQPVEKQCAVFLQPIEGVARDPTYRDLIVFYPV